MPPKLDLKKELKHLYAPTARQVHVVDVPEMSFLMVDGAIGPDAEPASSESFQQSMQALYGMSYTLKFMSKLREDNPIDYTVMALEALWWVEGGSFSLDHKEDWLWTVMIMQPDHITPGMVEEARRRVADKRPSSEVSRVQFERFHEGLSMQIMHIGPYEEEARTIEKMTLFAAENGYSLRGRHHEIYLGDPRRTKPENLKTVLRQPIEPAS